MGIKCSVLANYLKGPGFITDDIGGESQYDDKKPPEDRSGANSRNVACIKYISDIDNVLHSAGSNCGLH